MRHALYVAPFGELSDPSAVGDLAATAEASGWEGVFLWDHIWRAPERADRVGDTTVSLATIAMRTTSVRFGPMVVPLARRRPQKVARETVALDRLSGGRLIVGVGLGVNTDGELSRFGEVDDDVVRGDQLDEALSVLQSLWTGNEVEHHGPRYRADGVAFLPRPLQPCLPVWAAVREVARRRPLARAARLNGVFPVGASLAEVERMVDLIGEQRGTLDGFDVAMIAGSLRAGELERSSVTWALTALPSSPVLAEALEVARSGPT